MVTMAKVTPYFITGLPRSRTAWLAAWLSDGDSICLHDFISQCNGMDQLERRLIYLSQNYNEIGISDSGLPIAWRQIDAAYPHARVLVVHRQQQKAEDSYFQHFTRFPYKEEDPPSATETIKLMTEARNALLAMVDDLPSGRAMEVDYETLDDPLVGRAIWEFLLPGRRFCDRRWKLFNDLNIQTEPRKIHLRSRHHAVWWRRYQEETK